MGAAHGEDWTEIKRKRHRPAFAEQQMDPVPILADFSEGVSRKKKEQVLSGILASLNLDDDNVSIGFPLAKGGLSMRVKDIDTAVALLGAGEWGTGDECVRFSLAKSYLPSPELAARLRVPAMTNTDQCTGFMFLAPDRFTDEKTDDCARISAILKSKLPPNVTSCRVFADNCSCVNLTFDSVETAERYKSTSIKVEGVLGTVKVYDKRGTKRTICTNCLCHGHTSPYCRRVTTCEFCGEEHKGADCPVAENPAEHICVHCKKAGHSSLSEACPFRKVVKKQTPQPRQSQQPKGSDGGTKSNRGWGNPSSLGAAPLQQYAVLIPAMAEYNEALNKPEPTKETYPSRDDLTDARFQWLAEQQKASAKVIVQILQSLVQDLCRSLDQFPALQSQPVSRPSATASQPSIPVPEPTKSTSIGTPTFPAALTSPLPSTDKHSGQPAMVQDEDQHMSAPKTTGGKRQSAEISAPNTTRDHG